MRKSFKVGKKIIVAFKGFGKKQFAVVANDKKLLCLNVFGTGIIVSR